MPDSNWRLDAACKGKPSEWFFPAREDGGQAKEAKAVCADCPVREACLQWALQHERFGLWAGTNNMERRRLRRQQNIRVAAPQSQIIRGGMPRDGNLAKKRCEVCDVRYKPRQDSQRTCGDPVCRRQWDALRERRRYHEAKRESA